MPIAVIACGIGAAALRSSLVPGASAQDDAVRAVSESAPGLSRKRNPKPVPPVEAAPVTVAPPSGPPPAAASDASTAAKGAIAGKTAPVDVAVRLRENRAGACAGQVDAVAAGFMAGVQTFNTVSNWSAKGSNDHLVSVSIGQRYPDGTPIPYGATSVMAAPNGRGGCDAMAVQVVPSPLTCAKLRDAMSSSQRQMGDLGGIPVMQAPGGQTLLVPTGANTCVLVGLRTAYAP